jgi:hypothetical protein
MHRLRTWHWHWRGHGHWHGNCAEKQKVKIKSTDATDATDATCCHVPRTQAFRRFGAADNDAFTVAYLAWAGALAMVLEWELGQKS